MSATRRLLAEATTRLAEGGVGSPEYDAAELLAHVLGTTRTRLVVADPPTEDQRARYLGLIGRRAAREPLQHLTGSAAFRHVELAVGPGVFVPRPETELLAGWAIEAALTVAASAADPGDREASSPVVVNLCTGSGAIARALADEVPHAQIHAVEVDEPAHRWAETNLAGTGVELRLGDMASAFGELDGRVDVVVCNPPYVPLEAWESVAPEARDHDPHLALFSGADGLDALRVLERTAARLLRPGGVVGAEHAEVQAEDAPRVFASTGRWTQVVDHPDLAGRPRFVTARLAR